jgi:hypothetical protein
LLHFYESNYRLKGSGFRGSGFKVRLECYKAGKLKSVGASKIADCHAFPLSSIPAFPKARGQRLAAGREPLVAQPKF